jgi:hypothetical protein
VAIDFEADSVAKVTKEQLKRVAKMVKVQTDQEDKISNIELILEKENKRLQQIRCEIFPALLKEIGLTELKTSSGAKIEIKRMTTITIPADKRAKAFEWLRKHGFGSLIKTLVTARFGRGEEAKAKILFQKLIKQKLDAESSENIPHQTLSAFGREQMEKGKQLPKKFFTLFELDITKVTRPKNEV